MILGIGRVVSAQEAEPLLTDAIPKHAVRVSPLHLMNFYPTIQLGYEANIKGRFSLYLEGGVALNGYGEDPLFRDKRGFKLKVEPRHYFALNRKGNLLWYAAAEFYYNNIDFDRKTVRTECFDRDCQILYERQYHYTVGYREHGAGVKGGMMIGRRRFFLDINSGMAIRFIRYREPESFPDADLFDGALFNVPNETDRTAFMPLMGIRLGYRLVR